MIPANFEQADRVVTKPFGDIHDQVYDMPAFFGADADRYKPICFTYWRPSKEDIEAFQNGAGLYIKIFHPAVPAMHLQTENPFAPSEDLYVWMVGMLPKGDYPHYNLVANHAKALEGRFVSDDYFTAEQVNHLNFLFNNSPHPDMAILKSYEERALCLQDFRRSLIDKLKDIENEANNRDAQNN